MDLGGGGRSYLKMGIKQAEPDPQYSRNAPVVG